jgi:class 3 adenylate cyclase
MGALRKESMQPGVVGLRGAIVAAWEEELRAVRQDSFDIGRGREGHVFMQRFYGLIIGLRSVIQRAWGPRGLVHVVASAELGGPGCRISQSRIRLRNRGEAVAVELFSYADGTSRANPEAGIDHSIKVVGAEPLLLVTDMYRTVVDFLSLALNLDLALGGSAWLYEHLALMNFIEGGQWPSIGDVYRRATRELAVGDSYESVVAMFDSNAAPANGSNGSGEAIEMRLPLERMQWYVEAQPDLENFLKVVRVAVEADQEDRRVSSVEAATSLRLDELSVIKVGRLLAAAPNVVREGEFSPDFTEWSFLPSYNVHFFRRVHAIDDFVAVEASLMPRAAVNGATTTSPGGTSFKAEEASSLPDGIVTFLMTDVAESTSLWLQARSSMYSAMLRHDALLAAAIESNGGTVLKERGEGDSFFAVFPRATDAVVAAVEAQRLLQAEPWPDRLPISVRMAVLTGEADALDRDYRSPAVNRCAKLRRRAVGNQVLVSETTYSIVADILRDDIQLASVGKRRLEGHDRPEEIYVVQHPEVALEAAVEEDVVLA